MARNRIAGNVDSLQVVPVQSIEVGSRRIGEEEMFVDMATGARYLRGPDGQPESIVMARTSPGGGIGVAQIVSLTQAQYDALVAKDPATLYVVVEG